MGDNCNFITWMKKVFELLIAWSRTDGEFITDGEISDWLEGFVP